MKKFPKILITILLATVLVIALIACEEKNTHKGKFTHYINDADDLQSVSDMLGADYDNGTFELKSDVTVTDNWNAIGSSVENSFRGTLNGNGHTITYKINIPEPEERDTEAELEDEKFYGLFGVIHNATIRNLTVNVNISVPADSKSVFVGGLAGFMSGNNVIDNVTVSGTISTTMGNICKTIVSEDGSSFRQLERFEMAGYVGGVAGYVKGSTSITNINSSVAVDVDAYNDGAYKSALKDVFAGGIVGSMRTVDVSSGRVNSEYCTAKNLTYTGTLTAKGSLVNAGGIFGAAYRINDGEKWITETSEINAYAYERLRIGGVAGIIDRVNVTKAKAKLDSLNASAFSSSSSRAFSVGGLVGYSANFSSITDAISEVTSISVATDTTNYTGGLIGTMHYSTLKNATASGSLYYGRSSILDITYIRYDGNTRNNSYYTYNGGIVGRVYGESKLDNLATTFSAYQGIAGELANAIEIIKIKEDEGETYESWLASTVYDSAQLVVTKEGEKKDGEQKYRIVHNYDVSAANYSYITANSRCVNDIEEYPEAASERLVAVGTGESDASSYDELYNSLSAQINA